MACPLEMTSDNAESKDSAMRWVVMIQKIISTEEKLTIYKTIGHHKITSKVSPINEKQVIRGKHLTQGHACPLGGRVHTFK